MKTDYPTEQEAQERELAFILWQKQDMRNQLKAVNSEKDPYRTLDELRAKLTSWPALLFKRYEVARALALGWWHQNSPYEKGCIKDMLIASVVCGVLLGLLAWIASR